MTGITSHDRTELKTELTRIYFNSPHAWKFLSENGFIFTLRKCHTQRLPARFLEVDLIHDRKLVGKAKKLWVTTVVSNPVELKPYFRYSGFATAREWLGEARKLSGSADFWDLYLVFILRKEMEASL